MILCRLEGVQGYQPCPGGSIFNIAVGLGRLGTPVGFFSSLSTDFFGDQLANYLVENGVSTDFTLRASGPTTLAFVSLPDGRHTEPRYVFYANDAVDRSLKLADLPAELPKQVQALHFGSISLVLEPGASTLEALMRRESGQRVLSLDPNIRPSLITDREAYRQRFEGWLRLVDIVRLSLADLEWLYPGAEPKPGDPSVAGLGPQPVPAHTGRRRRQWAHCGRCKRFGPNAKDYGRRYGWRR